MIVLVTNMVYAALAIVLLIRLYNSEELMFGEEGTSIQIFTGRGALKKGGVRRCQTRCWCLRRRFFCCSMWGRSFRPDFCCGGF